MDLKENIDYEQISKFQVANLSFSGITPKLNQLFNKNILIGLVIEKLKLKSEYKPIEWVSDPEFIPNLIT